MYESEENKKNPVKTEFIFQIGIIVFIILGALIKQASWVFWILSVLCALGWVFFVQKRQSKDDKDN